MTYLSMTRGDDRVLEVVATDDLDGSDLTFTARHRPHSTESVIVKTTADGITVVGTTASIAIDAADTADLTPDVLYWDLEAVDSSNKTHTLATGRLAVEPDVTYGP